MSDEQGRRPFVMSKTRRLWGRVVYWQRSNGFLVREVARGSNCLFDDLTTGRASNLPLGKSRIKKRISVNRLRLIDRP
jgi:hypothetical protein